MSNINYKFLIVDISVSGGDINIVGDHSSILPGYQIVNCNPGKTRALVRVNIDTENAMSLSEALNVADSWSESEEPPTINYAQ